MHCGPPGNSEIRPANLIRWGESSNKTATHQSAKLLMPRHGSWPLVVVFARHKDSSACRSLVACGKVLGRLRLEKCGHVLSGWSACTCPAQICSPVTFFPYSFSVAPLSGPPPLFAERCPYTSRYGES